MILKRQAEEREYAITMKEVEVRALMGAIHAAAGNSAGVQASQKFALMKRPVKREDRPTIRELSKVFPAGAGAFGMFSAEEIAAEAARQKSAVA